MVNMVKTDPLVRGFGEMKHKQKNIITPDESTLLAVEGECLTDQGVGGDLRGEDRGGHQGPDQEHAGGVGRNRLKVRSS